ncbi:restriction endonuclease [Tumebacillus sp. ITR2]|uniref:Restriction endonuclease n=1 Tax=Tumebacillus amylolyticus TaxID=2801339 RepID=A0ABS1JCB5_9BACL|nr:restriction endonuclease [Tumebacillus amylolyticus]MBL0387268.1 restriction endonuclease [Tumebacillus amylolyticus]
MSEDRKLWFLPRPERDPKFHRKGLIALQTATNNFEERWRANRPIQKKYEEELVNLEVKREHVSESGSGGRTWAALLRTFSYCYLNDKGYLVPTKVGEAIIRRDNVRENIKKQILTLQIPNAYFLESGFKPKFEEGFQIRPARFLIHLTNQKLLDYYLTKEEITLFALKAKKDDEVPDVVQSILAFRTASPQEKQLIRQDIAATYDHRERSDNGARGFIAAHSDVAHTFMLIAEYTGLVEYLRGQSTIRIEPANSQDVSTELSWFDARYPFNTRYKISLERMAENNGLDITSYKANRLGSVPPATNEAKTLREVMEVLKDYPVIADLSTDQLEKILLEEFSPREAKKYAAQFSNPEYARLEPDFVSDYMEQSNHLKFEDQTGHILESIGFEIVMRPKPVTSDLTKIEILALYGDQFCGIIDAKNYHSNKFLLSSTFRSLMASDYIPNYEGSLGRKIGFFGYVTADKFSGDKQLPKITEVAKRAIPDRTIPGFIISAGVLLGFLDYCLENDIPKDVRVQMFLRAVKNQGYSNLSTFLDHAQLPVETS